MNPREFAQIIRRLWRTEVSSEDETAEVSVPHTSSMLPDLEDLEIMITSCLKSSIMRDERREVTFRLILCPPEVFEEEDNAHTALLFDETRPFNSNELLKLAPAVDFYRTVVGISHARNGELRIWGLVHSGPEWIQAISGGRGSFDPLPQWPVISVLGPGMLAAARGSFTLALLRQGNLTQPSTEVFESRWLPELFKDTREEVASQLRERVRRRGGASNRIEVDLVQQLGQHAVRRMISKMRRSRHGGAVLFLPPRDSGPEVPADLLRPKYSIARQVQRLMYRRALLDILEFLSWDIDCGMHPSPQVGWEDYKVCPDHRLKKLDDRLFEFAHLVSEVSQVDGAVVLDRRFQLLGFGAEILANHELTHVYRALDAEADSVVTQHIDDFGTRHRSAFRLCAQSPDTLAIVVSQDGSIAFIKNHHGNVTLWDQVAVSVLDI
jgi:hypothetical protein